MPMDHAEILTDAERRLRERFLETGEGGGQGLHASDAAPMRADARIETLVLPDELRGKMPLTKSKYIVKENPHEIQWEREVRKFLRKLSPDHEHLISAVMIYEWATGIRVKDIMAQEQSRTAPGRAHTTWRGDLRKINKILTHYFGKPYMTYIAGRKVPKAYKVKKGYLITRHRPMSLTLWTEYTEGVLKP